MYFLYATSATDVASWYWLSSLVYVFMSGESRFNDSRIELLGRFSTHHSSFLPGWLSLWPSLFLKDSRHFLDWTWKLWAFLSVVQGCNWPGNTLALFSICHMVWWWFCWVTDLGPWTDRVITLRSRTDHVIALRQISVTAQCYSSILFRR